jgi:hypothetical protein
MNMNTFKNIDLNTYWNNCKLNYSNVSKDLKFVLDMYLLNYNVNHDTKVNKEELFEIFKNQTFDKYDNIFKYIKKHNFNKLTFKNNNYLNGLFIEYITELIEEFKYDFEIIDNNKLLITGKNQNFTITLNNNYIKIKNTKYKNNKLNIFQRLKKEYSDKKYLNKKEKSEYIYKVIKLKL